VGLSGRIYIYENPELLEHTTLNMEKTKMPTIPWNESAFWVRWQPVLDREAHRSGGCNGLEARSTIWEVLMKRFPSGEVPGPNPSAYISKTIRLETRKFFKKRKKETQRLLSEVSKEKQRLLSNASSEPPRAISVEPLLATLTSDERDLLCRRYGLGGEAVSPSRLAQSYGITRQGIQKRLNRVLAHLRGQADHIHFAEQDAS